jgi:hypothetical protein
MRAGVDPAAKEPGHRLLDLHGKDVKKMAAGKWVAVRGVNAGLAASARVAA